MKNLIVIFVLGIIVSSAQGSIFLSRQEPSKRVPLPGLIVKNVRHQNESKANEVNQPSCLILSIGDNLKELLTSDNIDPVTVLLQHSIQTCPGLKSTIEILQKLMEIKGMNLDETLKFIKSIVTVYNVRSSNKGKPIDEIQENNDEESDKKEEYPPKHPLCFLSGKCEKSKVTQVDKNSFPKIDGSENENEKSESNEESAKKEENLCLLLGNCKENEKSDEKIPSINSEENSIVPPIYNPYFLPPPSDIDIDPEMYERIDRSFQKMIERMYNDQH